MRLREKSSVFAIAFTLHAASTVAQSIEYIDPVTDATLAAKEINVNLPVGAIAGSHAVSPTGGATYTIPIFSPPGTNGLQPSIALAYNSQGGDGLLGTGWSIQGLSAIGRTGSDDYHDGATAPVSYTAADHFALDGLRLVPTNGEDYGDEDAVYDTERAAFLWVTTPDLLSTGEPDYFEVRGKDGLRKRYGYLHDDYPSKVINAGQGTDAWLLNNVVDAFGNELQYDYHLDDATPRVKMIRWAGANAALEEPGVSHIEFRYKVRADRNLTYYHGTARELKHLLDEIIVVGDGNTVRRYELKYALIDGGRSVLSEMVEYGTDDVPLNSTIFKYGDGIASAGIEFDAIAVPGAGQDQYSDFLTGDFDGNGRSDLVQAIYFNHVPCGESASCGVIKVYTAFRVFLNGNYGTYYQHTFTEQSYAQMEGRYGMQGFYCSDINGDGRDDIVVSFVEWEGLTQKYFFDKAVIWFSECITNDAPDFEPQDLGRPDAATPWEEAYSYLYPKVKPRQYLLTGDFTGDGRSDLLTVLYNNDWGTSLDPIPYPPDMRTYLWSTASGSWVQQSLDAQVAGYLTYSKALDAISFNADAKLDLMLRIEEGAASCCVAERRADGSWGAISISASPEWYPDPNGDMDEFEIAVGDLNGDGFHDVLQHQSQNLILQYGTGAGWSTEYVLASNYTNNSSRVLLADFNADGRSDFYHSRLVNGATVITLKYSTGLGPSGPEFMTEDLPPYEENVVTTNLGDWNADGRPELLNHYYVGQAADVLIFRPFGTERLLDQVMDGMLNTVDFNYGCTSDPAIYEDGLQSTEYPDHDCDMPLMVVAEVITPNGTGDDTWSDEYAYEDGFGWINGPGFLGFRGLVVRSNRSDQQTGSTYTPGVNVAALFPDRTQVSDVSTAMQLNASDQDYGENLLGGMRRYLGLLLNELSTNMLSEITTTKSTAYTAFSYNPLNSTTTVGDIQTVLEVFDFNGFGPGYPYVYQNRLTSHSVSTTRTGAPPIVRLTEYDYDLTSGELLWRKEFATSAAPLLYEVLERYAEGPVKREMLSYTWSYGAGERETKYKYDELYRLPSKVTQMVTIGGPQVPAHTLVEYDLATGLELSTIAPDGLKVRKRYNGFGQLESIQAPHLPGQERYETTTLTAWAIDEVPGSLYKTTITHPGEPQRISYFDRLGREIESWVMDFTGVGWSISKFAYDPSGRLHTKTEPALAGEPQYTLEFVYDELGRAISETHSLLGETSTSYLYENGLLKTTVTSPAGQARSTWTDETGMMVKAEDHGGALRYQHNSLGQVIKVVHGSSTAMTIEYDDHGNRSELWDQSAGTTLYRYDPFGQLVWQKSANGDEKSMMYDELGRLLWSTEPEGDVSYSYYYQDDRISSKPVQVEGFGTTDHFEYDELLRLAGSLRETPQGDGVERAFTYDEYDRLHMTAFSGPIAMRLVYGYTAGGHLKTVLDPDEQSYFFRAAEMDGQGRYRNYYSVDNQATAVVYEGPFPTHKAASSFQDLHMEWDPITGNLLSRWDALKLRKETFEYDELDRLKKAKAETTDDIGAPQWPIADLKYGYDQGSDGSRGNLVNKKDVGLFGYDQGAIVSAVHGQWPVPSDAPPLVISLEEQHISYTSFHQPYKITERFGEALHQLDYEYGPGHQRVFGSHAIISGPLVRTWLYDGEYERQYDEATAQTHHIIYIEGGAGLCGMVVFEGTTNPTRSNYAVYTDHLGSIVAITKPLSGEAELISEQNFDAWGRMRNPDSWQYENLPEQPLWLYRGYTGHEHIEPFALININGRMYDPVNGRMLSPDNYVAGASSSQALNRYSYANNNPLKYVDPNGENPFLIGAVVGGLTNWLMNGAQFNAAGFGHFMFGAAAGVAGAGVFSASTAVLGTAAGFINGAIAGTGSGIASGFVAGMGNSMIAGGGLAGSAMAGLRSAAVSGAVGGAIGGLAGGLYASAHGGDFWTAVGMRHDTPAGLLVQDASDPVEYSNESARSFSDQYLCGPKNMRNLYADGTVSEGYTLQGDVAIGPDGPALGVTVYQGKGISDVYLYKSAFSSKDRLYLVMQHEYMHVGYYGTGKHMNLNRQEAGARQWMLEQGKAWSYPKVDGLQLVYDQMKQYMHPKYHYSVLGIRILQSTPW